MACQKKNGILPSEAKSEFANTMLRRDPYMILRDPFESKNLFRLTKTRDAR